MSVLKSMLEGRRGRRKRAALSRLYDITTGGVEIGLLPMHERTGLSCLTAWIAIGRPMAFYSIVWGRALQDATPAAPTSAPDAYRVTGARPRRSGAGAPVIKRAAQCVIAV